METHYFEANQERKKYLCNMISDQNPRLSLIYNPIQQVTFLIAIYAWYHVLLPWIYKIKSKPNPTTANGSYYFYCCVILSGNCEWPRIYYGQCCKHNNEKQTKVKVNEFWENCHSHKKFLRAAIIPSHCSFCLLQVRHYVLILVTRRKKYWSTTKSHNAMRMILTELYVLLFLK